MLARITIKELHSTTGDHVRRAGTSRSAVVITDRGLPVAVLANPSLLKPRRRKRTIVPGYETMMSERPGNNIQAALDEIRGDR
jgi:hypothetical protein